MYGGKQYSLVGLAAILLGCGDTTSPQMPSLRGNFEGVLQTGGYPWYLGLALDDEGGVVGGTGFLSVYPSLTATVNGSTDGELVEFDVSPAGSGLTYQYTGRLHGDTISGSFVPGAGTALPLELVRVDTVATGRQDISLSLSTIREESGIAYFLYFLSHAAVFLVLESAGSGPYLKLTITWDGMHYPPRGTHQVGTTGGPRIQVEEITGNSVFRSFTVESGVVMLDRARRFALIGSLDIIARDAEGSRTRVQGSFSAGCIEQYC